MLRGFRNSRPHFFVVPILLLASAACSILHTRPVQEMSDTSAAIRAAREVQADTLAPELFRQAIEWFDKAKVEYKLKNFMIAEEYANKARRFAEQAEFESIRGGANRVSTAPPDPISGPAYPPYEYPEPTGIPAADYDARMGMGMQSQPPAPEATETPPPP